MEASDERRKLNSKNFGILFAGMSGLPDIAPAEADKGEAPRSSRPPWHSPKQKEVRRPAKGFIPVIPAKRAKNTDEVAAEAPEAPLPAPPVIPPTITPAVDVPQADAPATDSPLADIPDAPGSSESAPAEPTPAEPTQTESTPAEPTPEAPESEPSTEKSPLHAAPSVEHPRIIDISDEPELLVTPALLDKSESEDQPEAAGEPEDAPEPETQTKPEAQMEPETQTEPENAAEPETQPEPENPSESDSQDGPETVASVEPAADLELAETPATDSQPVEVSAEELPAREQPAEEQSAEEQPAEEQTPGNHLDEAASDPVSSAVPVPSAVPVSSAVVAEEAEVALEEVALEEAAEQDEPQAVAPAVSIPAAAIPAPEVPAAPAPPEVPLPEASGESEEARPPVPTFAPVVAPQESTMMGAITLDDGTTYSVLEKTTLGRHPANAIGAKLAISDPRRTMSKSHLQVRSTTGGLTLVDLGSTNGTRVVSASGISTALRPHAPTFVEIGSTVYFGSRSFTVTPGKED